MALPYFLITNQLRDATVISDETITDHPIENALDGRTSTQAGFEAGATRTVIFDFGTTVNLTHFGYVGTNLGTVGGSISFAHSSDNVTYTNSTTTNFFATVYTAELGAVLTNRYLRVRISNHYADVYISDLFVGEAIELPYDVPVGFVRPEWADEDTIETNMTGGGAIVGVTVTRRPKKTSLDMRSYPSEFFSSYWDVMIRGLKEYPGYFKWRDGVANAMYCSLVGKAPRPSYTSHMHLSVKLDLEGIVDELSF